jgi:FKBP-type peptidyl-prolyl cis-trans isomerase
MKNQSSFSILTCLALVASITFVAAPSSAQEDETLATEDSKILYSLGFALAQNLQVFSLTPEELAAVGRGIEDSVLGNELKVDINEYGPKIQGFAQQRIAASAALEKAASESFLEEMASADGAVTTDSGLIVTEGTAGTGATPTEADTVTVHYHGTLRDGSVFDSSIERGEPATFPLTAVIPCWTEGLQTMKVGGKSRLVCPSAIAYGDEGRPPGIPGGAALVFEVELLSIGGESSDG